MKINQSIFASLKQLKQMTIGHITEIEYKGNIYSVEWGYSDETQLIDETSEGRELETVTVKSIMSVRGINASDLDVFFLSQLNEVLNTIE